MSIRRLLPLLAALFLLGGPLASALEIEFGATAAVPVGTFASVTPFGAGLDARVTMNPQLQAPGLEPLGFQVAAGAVYWIGTSAATTSLISIPWSLNVCFDFDLKEVLPGLSVRPLVGYGGLITLFSGTLPLANTASSALYYDSLVTTEVRAQYRVEGLPVAFFVSPGFQWFAEASQSGFLFTTILGVTL